MSAAPPKAEVPTFHAVQRMFASHIRSPGVAPLPADVDPRRLRIYQELFYNNVEGLLSSVFPVLRSVLPDQHWEAMVRGFFAAHRCHTPLFHEIAQEFLVYLGDERDGQPDDPAYLLELAHYEWVELALQISDAAVHRCGVDPNGSVLEGIPVLSPLAWPLSYSYPVHRIGPDSARPAPQTTYLVAYRDRHDAVGFLEINAVTARLLALVAAESMRSGRELLEQISVELQHPKPQLVIEAGLEIMQGLRAREVLLGTR